MLQPQNGLGPPEGLWHRWEADPGADPGDQHIWGAVAQPCWDLPAGGN